MDDLSIEFGIPTSLTREIFSILKQAGLITEVTSDKKGRHFQPAQAMEKITFHSVVSAMNGYSLENIPVNSNSMVKRIKEAFNTYLENGAESPLNISLFQLD